MARVYLGYTSDPDHANLDEIPRYPELSGETGVTDETFDYGDARRYGATTTDTSGAANRTAIVSALTNAAVLGLRRIKPCPEGGTYLVNDNFTITPTHNGITVDLDGGCVKLADTLNAGNVEAAWMWMLKAQSALAPLVGFRIINGTLDGSRGTTTWADSSYGVIAYQDSYLEDCAVESVIAHDFRSSGMGTYTGGITFRSIDSYDNTDHGVAVSVDNTFTGVASVYNLRAHGNGGYGLDAGRGCRTFVRGLETYENVEGGFKYSIGTIFLDIDGVVTYNNGTPGVSGPGFTDTDTTGDGVILIGSVTSFNNAGPGFRCVAANTLSIGRIVSYDNDCYVASVVAEYDILIGSAALLEYFDAEFLYSGNAPNNGIFIDGDVKAYQIGRVEAVGCQDAGFVDSTTGPCSGVLMSGLFRNNNRAATAGAAGAALQVERTGTFKAFGCTFTDDQMVPTQVSGMRFTSGVKAHVDGCHFGTGITTGVSPGHVFTATTGTVVTFGNGNTGLVTRASATGTVNGGGTTATLTYGTALTNLGGAVLFPLAYPSSADAAEANYISSVTVTELVMTCPTTFTAGSGNVAFRYDVRMEIQR